jgi:hypothetical protein
VLLRSVLPLLVTSNVLSSLIPSTLMKEVIYSSKTSKPHSDTSHKVAFFKSLVISVTALLVQDHEE